MKEETKKILKKIKSVSDFDDYVDFIGTEFKPLLDYITNLQESEAYYYGQYKDYKSRCEKAIEYINNNSLYEETYDYNTDDEQELQYVSDETATNDLLNILRGEGNNE